MAASDVAVTQDGDARLHPYIVAIVRWCISCLWSTASVLLHRLMTAPLPPITGKLVQKSSKPRPASRDHLDPVPKVECVVLHHPEDYNMDVIFVHGLYGSLANTWRQGEWHSKYNAEPERKHLRRPTLIPTPCQCSSCNDRSKEEKTREENQNNDEETSDNDKDISINDEEMDNMFDDFEDNDFTNIDEKFYSDIKRIIPNDEVFITEKFYNNTLLDQVEIVDNYETQAQFVRDLFKKCDVSCEEEAKEIEFITNSEKNDQKTNVNNNDRIKLDRDENVDDNCKVKHDEEINCKCKMNREQCDVGCGCICDGCYSHCWPKDWIKVDYPNARVISINYTSDPHLWRPLWVKENKRLRLHERAEQMTEQLLNLGVGERPVVWVGHSKGGLFIKQIYCEAYEAHLKSSQKETEEQNVSNNNTEQINNNDKTNEIEEQNVHSNVNFDDESTSGDDITECTFEIIDESKNANGRNALQASSMDEALRRSSLWRNSVAFMYYSVPHRGSPLADIKTPVTARSVELQEIAKDCSLVLSLQERWLAATAPSSPLVRSLVETRRTLMSVLWLTIVTPDSADPGIGSLCGISVDHREICKPSSRQCPLYTELAKLIAAAVKKRQAIDK